MSTDNESAPLMDDVDGHPEDSHNIHEEEESTPLLLNTDTPRYDGEERVTSPAASSLRSIQSNQTSSSRRSSKGTSWPTQVAVTALATLFLAIVFGFFFAPAAVEEYAKESLVIEPTGVSIDSITSNGVRARIQAKFRMDASRVKNDHVRNIGRVGTWLAHKIETDESRVSVYLPEYDNVLIGTAVVPKVIVSIRNGETTDIDFLCDLVPGDAGDIRRVANDWLEGRLGQLRVRGSADIALRSGIIPLGTQTISESLVLEGNNIPAMPQYDITRLNFHEVDLPSNRRGMAADISLSVNNKYPIKFTVPPLDFDILVPNCASDEPYIVLAEAVTDTINIEPESKVVVNVGGVVRELPEPLTKSCPETDLSPLDVLLGEYINGEDATVFVRGSKTPSPQTPKWISGLIDSITVPVPFPGRNFDNLVKNFTLENVHFGMPDSFAEPGTPGASPKISGDIIVTAGLPKEMNFGINVTQVQATADVYYKDRKFGVLDLKNWQEAKSRKITGPEDTDAALEIKSRIRDAPLNITNEDIFSEVVQELIFGNGDGILLEIKALVDVKVETVLGTLVIKRVPGGGIVPVKAPSKGGFGSLNPRVFGLKILDTGKTSLTFQAMVNFTNPTSYTATVPSLKIHILNNASIIAGATVSNLTVVQGNNTNVLVEAVWDPQSLGGNTSRVIGRNLLSQYISGWNTTLTFKTYNESIPHQPTLGEALSKFEVEIPTPRLSSPHVGEGDEDDEDGSDRPRFIKEATFHIFSSTAVFTLQSPLQHSPIYIDNINATAFYNHTEPVGQILYGLPFKVPPGLSITPRLPVDWSSDSIGYDKMKKAIGGDLKLGAKATVKIRLGHWSEEVWFEGEGIGAKIRL